MKISSFAAIVAVIGVMSPHWAIAQSLRVPASAFRNGPAPIRQQIAGDGCTVPQIGLPTSSEQLHNVISGEFAATGQRDWAAVCWKAGTTTLRIYWGGPSRCPQIEWADWWESIHRASTTRMRQAAAEWDQRIPRVTHDGIELGSEKAAEIHYCDKTRWITFISAD